MRDRVTFAGRVGRGQISAYVAAFDIALQPDVVSYASPLKLLEYMALEAAIVAPDTPNIREIVTHDVDAVLFDPDSNEAFANAVSRVCNDAALCARVGRQASDAIDAKGFTWADNAVRIEELMNSLIQQRTLNDNWKSK